MRDYRWLFGALALTVALPGASLARPSTNDGPNTGGYIVLHVNDAVVYTDGVSFDDQSGVEQASASDCAGPAVSNKAALQVTTAKGLGEVFVMWALAVFQEEACPVLKAAVFGIDYNPTNFVILASGALGDFELTTPNTGSEDWPAPLSSTAITFDSPRRSHVVELYWFAAAAYYQANVCSLVPHTTQGAGGAFADNGTPALLNLCEGFGTLGAGGATGSLPSQMTPTEEASWGSVKAMFGH